MTASAPITGNLRAIPDAASAPPPDSGVPAHANFRSVLEQYHSSHESDSNSNDTHGAPQQKQKDSDPTTTLAIPQSVAAAVQAPRPILPLTTSITLRQDTTTSPDDAAAAAPPFPAAPADDPSTPLLPVTSSTALDPARTALQNSSTVSEVIDITSTTTSDIGASILANSRTAAYRYRLSQDRDSAKVAMGRTLQLQQTASDPTPTITAPVTATEVPVTTVDPQRPIHPPAASNAPRQDESASQTSSTDTQDSSAASQTDPKSVMSPVLERADDTTAALSQGSLAFAARLTPTEETAAATPDTTRMADSQSRAQTALQSATAASAKQIASETDLPADAHSGESGSQPDKDTAGDRFAKPEMVQLQTHASFQDQTAATATSHAPSSPLSPAARMDQVQDPPATASNGNHDITIRVPDSTDQGTAVRFVERAGEVHVSVRTSDTEMAQTLRGGLSDLVNRLEDGGIRTQVWQPGGEASTSQNDSHQPFADPDGSNGRQYSSGSNSEQESKQQNKPRWVEELEGSIGNQNPKETPQLLWQA
jgi:hypothetical protein